MASINTEVAALLREYAELLGLTGGDQFRVRSYEREAKAVAGYPDDLGTLPEKALTKAPDRRTPGGCAARRSGEAALRCGILLRVRVPGSGRAGLVRRAQ